MRNYVQPSPKPWFPSLWGSYVNLIRKYDVSVILYVDWENSQTYAELAWIWDTYIVSQGKISPEGCFLATEEHSRMETWRGRLTSLGNVTLISEQLGDF